MGGEVGFWEGGGGRGGFGIWSLGWVYVVGVDSPLFCVLGRGYIFVVGVVVGGGGKMSDFFCPV